MFEIGHGIEVYYENKKEKRNIVFFPENTYKYYDTGGMLFEAITDEATFLITTKLETMIHDYPGYADPLTIESVTDGFKWLYGTVQDEERPVVTELFRSGFTEVIKSVLTQCEHEDSVSFENIGAFMERCYTEYFDNLKAFSAFFDALAADASGTADDFQQDVANTFKRSTEDFYTLYKRKCNVRKGNGNVSAETHQITNYLQLLVFEYYRLKKEGKAVKICANCGRYFIPKNRSDSIYCDAPAPQNPTRTCKEIGSQVKRAEERHNNSGVREHQNKMSSLGMAKKRAKDKGDDDLLSGYERLIRAELKRFEKTLTDNTQVNSEEEK